MTRLAGGAVQENWRLDVAFDGGDLAGRQRLVLRTNACTTLSLSHHRAAEFAVQRAAFAAGVSVPEPLFLCTDTAILGKPFTVMRWAEGSADGERVVSGALGGDRHALAERLARELARIQAITPRSADLACLGRPPEDPARAQIDMLGRRLAAERDPHPVAEWGLRWLIAHAPAPVAPVLCHGDFRTGNYLADEHGFTALLDWEFAHWGDPDEDLGWFSLGYWRFGAYDREAGGIVPRAVFHRAYAAASGRSVDPRRARYWEVAAALRWLLIALEQRDRFLDGGERSLQLVLNGRRPAECEYEILRLIEAM